MYNVKKYAIQKLYKPVLLQIPNNLITNLTNYPGFSAGGLVTAVAPVVVKGNGIWIGWPGVYLQEGEQIPESDPNDTTPTSGLRSNKVC